MSEDFSYSIPGKNIHFKEALYLDLFKLLYEADYSRFPYEFDMFGFVPAEAAQFVPRFFAEYEKIVPKKNPDHPHSFQYLTYSVGTDVKRFLTTDKFFDGTPSDTREWFVFICPVTQYGSFRAMLKDNAVHQKTKILVVLTGP